MTGVRHRLLLGAFAIATTVLAYPVAAQTDYDSDDDGLIEITTLEQLDAIRFDFDGDGVPGESTPTYAEAFPDAADNMVQMGCPGGICSGYELMNDLDFDDPTSYAASTANTAWTSDAGWPAIGNATDSFSATFNGNGHTIANLHIDDSTRLQGLFGYVSGTVSNIGVTGAASVFTGGGVAGLLRDGTVERSYSTVSVNGDSSVGSLLGLLVPGTVRLSYATGVVFVSAGLGGASGGLLGASSDDDPSGSNKAEHVYATGFVDRDRGGANNSAGGLLGSPGLLELQYAYTTALVGGSGGQSGGLAGGNDDDFSATAVYWDTEASGRAVAIPSAAKTGVDGRTAAELQAPTTYAGIYANWDEGDTADYWDFGNASQYPALKIDFDNNSDASWEEFGYQLREGPRLREGLQRVTQDKIDFDLRWSAPDTSHWDSPPQISYRIYRDGSALEIGADDIGETLDANGDTVYSYADAGLSGDTVHIYHIAAVVGGGEPSRSAIVFEADYDRDDDGLIEINTLEQLNAIRWDPDGDGKPANASSRTYAEAFPGITDNTGCPDTCGGYELINDLDFEDPRSYAVADPLDYDWIDNPDDGNAEEGWPPISGFTATFNGNGHAVYNLYVSRNANDQGLFGSVSGTITNIGITGLIVSPVFFAGGLAGQLNNGGMIEKSYSAVAVEDGIWSGSLAGMMNGGAAVRLSYASGVVNASANAGGLLGVTLDALIPNTTTETLEHVYATGFVDASDAGNAGGLTATVGALRLKYIYATALVSGSGEGSSGLGGYDEAGFAATAVYWDTETSNQSVGVATRSGMPVTGVEGKTTAELQAPTTYTGIYANWDEGDTADYWDFGTAEQYPALKIDFDNNDMARWQEFGYQLREGPQNVEISAASATGITLSWTAPDTSHWDNPPSVTYALYRDGAPLSLAADAIAETADANGDVVYSYADLGASADTAYRYHIAATVNGGEPSRSYVFAGRLGVTDRDAALNTIAESGTTGTAVSGLRLSVTEMGAAPFGDVIWGLDDPTDTFGISAASAEIGLLASDTLDYASTRTYSVAVTATLDGTELPPLPLTINVLNDIENVRVQDDDPSPNRVLENTPIDTPISGLSLAAYEMPASGGSVELEQATWSLADNADFDPYTGGIFAIDAAAGTLTLVAAADYETSSQHSVWAVAAVTHPITGDVLRGGERFEVRVVNIPETLTIMDGDPAANTIAENATTGTAVTGIALQAHEDDLPLTGGADFRWELTDTAADLFAIDPVSGEITLVASGMLNYEDIGARTHSVTVRAVAGAVVSDDLELTISVLNVPDTLTIIDSDMNANTIAENAVANMPVTGIVLSASDEAGATVSAVTWSVASSPTDLFTIDAGGAVRLSASDTLDYETTTMHTIEVRGMADGIRSDTLSLTIVVTDFDETIVPPTVTDADPAANTIAENSTDTAVSGVALAAIRDGNQLSDITWILTDDADGLFVIATDTGVIKTATDRAPDYEAAVRHAVTAVAIAADGSIVALDLPIEVRNVPESLTIADSDTNANAIAENATTGTEVAGINLTVTDEGGDGVSGVSWSLESTPTGLFGIDTDGVITLAASGRLDYDAGARNHSVMVTAAAAGYQSATATLTINVTNVLEELKIANRSTGTTIALAEDATTGTGTVVPGIDLEVTDEADREVTEGLTWSLVTNPGNLFAISTTSGEITLAGKLNYEAATQHTVMVQAAKGEINSAPFSLTIRVTVSCAAPATLNSATNVCECSAPNVGMGSDCQAPSVQVCGALMPPKFFRETACVDFVFCDAPMVLDAMTNTCVPPQLRIADTAEGANEIAETATTDTEIAGVTLEAQYPAGVAVSGVTVTWGLSDNADGLFTIGSASGVITLAASGRLDYDAGARNHSVMVTAAAAGYQSATATLTINVTNVLEELKIANRSTGTTIALAEDATTGTGTVVPGIDLEVTDEADREVTEGLTWSLVTNPGNLFAISTTSGEITLAGKLNYEAATQHTVTVQAAKGEINSAPFSLTIRVTVSCAAPATLNSATNVCECSAPNVGMGSDCQAPSVQVCGALMPPKFFRETACVDFVFCDAPMVLDAMTNTCVPPQLRIADTAEGANEIAETATTGTEIAGVTLEAQYPAGVAVSGVTVTWGLSDNADGLFTIGSTSGVITLAASGRLDYDAGARNHSVMVTAAAAGYQSATATLTINVTNVLEELKIANRSTGTTIALAEDATTGTGTMVPGIDLEVTDEADREVTEGLTWSLVTNPGNLFAISTTSGEITLAGKLNYEAATQHTVTVQAAKGEINSAPFSLTIRVTVSCAAPATLNSATNVCECSAPNVGMGSDCQAPSVQVCGALMPPKFFRETACVDFVFCDAPMVLDAMTNTCVPPQLRIADTAEGANEIAETATTDTEIAGVTLEAQYPAGVAVSGVTVTWGLSDNADGLFTIGSASGVITLAASGRLDYDAGARNHSVMVTAAAAGYQSATATLTINVTNVLEELKIANRSTGTTIALAEDATTGTGTVVPGIDLEVTDEADREVTEGLTWSLVTNPGNLFAISTTSGEITLAGKLNYEAATQHTVMVQAAKGEINSAPFSLTINVLNVLEELKVANGGSGEIALAENATIDTVVPGIALEVTDEDDNTVSGVEWSLASAPSGLFAIGSTSGVITLAASGRLDYDAGARNHSVTVTAAAADYEPSTLTLIINVLNVLEELAISDSDAAAAMISEAAVFGSALTGVALTVSAEEGGTIPDLTWRLSRNPNRAFAIASTNGAITLAREGVLDFETAPSIDIEVIATPRNIRTEVPESNPFPITVTVTNALETLEVDDTARADNSISENAATGTAVAGVVLEATDEDANLVSGVTWILKSTPADLFTIDNNPGVIRLVAGGRLDFETTPSVAVMVQAAKGEIESAPLSLTIAVEDALENLTVRDSNADANRIAEDAATGTQVLGIALSASETDNPVSGVKWSLSDASGLFAIGADTGVISLIAGGSLDFATTPSVAVMVQAEKDEITSDPLDLTITVLDTDENIRIVDTAGDDLFAAIDEDAEAGDALSGLALVARDAAANVLTGVVWSLNDDADSRFAIATDTGVITVAGMLDYETTPTHTVVIRATHEGNSSDFVLQVNVGNVLETLAVTDSDDDANTITENATSGTAVSGIALRVTDEGSRPVTEGLDWILASDPSGLFAISTDGAITATAPLDYETTPTTHTVMVQVAKGDITSSAVELTIDVGNVLELLTVTDSDEDDNTIAETATSGTAVAGIALAVTDEGGRPVTEGLTWSLVTNPGNLFAISVSGGEIALAGEADYETTPTHVLRVAAAADGISDAIELTVEVQNALETLMISDRDDDANEIVENVATATAVSGIDLAALDEAGTEVTDGLVWRLTENADGRFAIDSDSGVITAGRAFDYETSTQTSFSVTVAVTKDGVDSAPLSLSIALRNVLESLTLEDINAAANGIDENALAGVAVSGISFVARDEAGNEVTAGLTWTLPESAGDLFVISNQGVISVTKVTSEALDAENVADYALQARVSKDGVDSNIADVPVVVRNLLEELTIANGGSGAIALAEDATTGAVVPGIALTATDEGGNAVSSATWSLTDASGLFAISADTGVISLIAANTLDYDIEALRSHTVRAQASKDGVVSGPFALTIDVTDVLETLQIVDNNPAEDTIIENAASGTAVSGIELAAENEAGDSVRDVLWSLTDNAGGLFAISTAGAITATAPLDHETTPTHAVIVRAEKDGINSAPFLLTIAVGDVLERLTVADGNADANRIAEDATSGTQVLGITLSASDEKSEAVTDVTWSLSDDAGGRFAISADTGVISLIADSGLNFATTPSVAVTVQAEKDGVHSAGFELPITVLEVNENVLIVDIEGDDAFATIDEDATTGTMLSGARLVARDADSAELMTGVTWSLSDAAGGLFAIATDTAVITLTGMLDYETTPTHTVVIRATHEGNSSNFVLQVNVGNVLESLTATDSDEDANTIAETATTGTAVAGIVFAATDEGGRPVTEGLTWSLAADPSGLFAISTGGEVTLIGTADYETTPTHTVMVQVAKGGTTSSAVALTIDVTNIPETLTVTNADSTGTAMIAVAENAIIGTRVPGIRLIVTDEAGTEVAEGLTWSSTSTLFMVNPATGVIATSAALDYETATSHTITVTAASGGVSGSIGLTIDVEDVLETLAITDDDPAANTIPENASIASVAGVDLTVADEGGNPVTGVAWALTDNAGGRFEINPNFDLITATAPLDYESSTNFVIMVRATSDGVNSASFPMTIEVTNVFETLKIVDNNAADNTIAANADTGAIVDGVELEAIPDIDEGRSIAWMLVDNSEGLFQIDAHTGVISLMSGGALDYDARQSHTVRVQAQAVGGPEGSEDVRSNVLEVIIAVGTDYDRDDDNLIEITTLEQLDAVRYDLDGDGKPSTGSQTAYEMAFPDAAVAMGCASACTGYELLNGLDFAATTNTAWTSGEGWEPIGDGGNHFTAIFNGNGNTIANLHINRNADSQGLFGVIGGNGTVTNVGVTGSVTSDGYIYAGGLAGRSYGGAIERSYSTVSVNIDDGIAGSLLGFGTGGEVRASYATGNVHSGGSYAGGLIAGTNADSRAEHVYATGYVNVTDSDRGLVGGLFGAFTNRLSLINYAYSTAFVNPTARFRGGISGGNESSNSIFASVYWDTETSGVTAAVGAGVSDGITAQTTAGLQTPTTYTGIYANWNANDADGNPTDYWDFGENDEYPALKIDFNNDDRASWQEFGCQLRQGPIGLGIAPGNTDTAILNWTAPDTSHCANAGITYRVYRGGVALASTAAVTYTAPGATEGATYYVAAVINGGEASRSAIAYSPPIPPALTIADSNDADNAIAGDAAAGTEVSGIELIVRDENGADVTDDVSWELTDNADGMFAINAEGVITVAGALTAGDQTITVQAERDGVTSDPFELIITVEASVLRLRLRLFLEGPLR